MTVAHVYTVAFQGIEARWSGREPGAGEACEGPRGATVKYTSGLR